jgi:ATP-dependent protease ClpP protease subunit
MKDFKWPVKIGLDSGEKSKEAGSKPQDQFIYKEPSFLEVVENRIYFYSEVSRESILKLNKELRNLSLNLGRSAHVETREPASIYLHVNSYGGSLFAGLSGMDEILKTSVPVITVVDGCSASAATLLNIVGRKRLINSHAYMLIHQLSSFMWGKYEEFKDEMQNLDKLMEMIRKVYREYSRIPMEKLEEILKHDLWFDAERCLDYGLADEVVV